MCRSKFVMYCYVFFSNWKIDSIFWNVLGAEAHPILWQTGKQRSLSQKTHPLECDLNPRNLIQFFHGKNEEVLKGGMIF